MNGPIQLAGTEATRKSARLPTSVVYTTLTICALPLALHLFGVDLGSPKDHVGAFPPGPVVHTLLEWTAVCLAGFIVLLSLLHYSSEGDVVTPVIALALLASGVVDAFHTLAADQIISASTPDQDFIPFTWALSRLFNSIVMFLVPALLVFMNRDRLSSDPRFVVGTAFVLGSFAFVAMWICTVSSSLPRTQFPAEMITRPYDLLPLILFVAAAAIIYPRLVRKRPGIFSQAVFLSAVPDIATQLYMAFGSSALFDNFFHIAHFTKIVAYSVPLAGLSIEYVSAHHVKKLAVGELTRANESLRTEIEKRQRSEFELLRSNQELDAFAYIASHDLKEPLRGIHNYSTFLLEDYAERLDEAGREKLETLTRLTKRMETLINSLLYFSRVGRVDLGMGPVSLQEVVEEVVDSLHISLEEAGVEIRISEELPTVACDRARICEVLRNLITNGMKYNDRPEKWIEIGCRRESAGLDEAAPAPRPAFYVRDNGIGIREKHIDKVFQIFKRLNGRDQYGGGTGFGLTIAKKIVDRHGGRIWVESTFGEGTTFYFTLGGTEDGTKPHDDPCS